MCRTFLFKYFNQCNSTVIEADRPLGFIISVGHRAPYQKFSLLMWQILYSVDNILDVLQHNYIWFLVFQMICYYSPALKTSPLRTLKCPGIKKGKQFSMQKVLSFCLEVLSLRSKCRLQGNLLWNKILIFSCLGQCVLLRDVFKVLADTPKNVWPSKRLNSSSDLAIKKCHVPLSLTITP